MSGDAERQRLLHVSDQDASGDEPDQNFVEDAGKKKRPTAMRLLKFGRPELPLVILATFLSSISAFLHMSQNVFVGMVINTVHYNTLEAGQRSLTTFTLVLLSIYIGDCLSSLFAGVLYAIAATRCSCRLRTLVLRNMVRQDVAFFDTVRVGELLNRLSTDTEVIQMVVTANLAGWFIPLAQVVIGLIAIFAYNWRLTLVVLSLIPVIAVCMFLQGFCMRILTEKELIALADAMSKADETLSNIRTVRSFVAEEKEIGNYADKINVSYLISKKRAWISGGLSSFTNLAGDTCILVAMWYGGHMIFANEMSVGGLVSYMLFALQSVFAFSSLISIFPQFMEALGASTRVFELLDRKPAVNYDGGKIPTNGIEGHITLKNVMFHYPSRPKVKVLNGVSFQLPQGKTLALVGPSGCGKSTLICLLERFYDVQGGQILIDGMDLITFDPQWLRDQIGLVSQEPVLFAMSVEENIMYGSKIINHARIEQAARLSNAHEFIMSLPMGYEAQVGERGVMLSGGQKQRIAIARAVLKDPKLLLLDEATSSLDAENEKLVQDALDKLMVGRTCVVVAHRLSTIRNADTIAVLADGKIQEQGTHEELIKMNGLYATLGRRQFLLDQAQRNFGMEADQVKGAVGMGEKLSVPEIVKRVHNLRMDDLKLVEAATMLGSIEPEPDGLAQLVKDMSKLEEKMHSCLNDLLARTA